MSAQSLTTSGKFGQYVYFAFLTGIAVLSLGLPANATPAAAGAEKAQQEHVIPKNTNGGAATDNPPADKPVDSGPATSGASPPAGAMAVETPANVGKTTGVATTGATAGITATPEHGATAEDGELAHQDWPFAGVFGTYDRAALQRGFQVYRQICSACHSLNFLSYRNLQDIGYTEGQVKAIAAQYQVPELNDEGEAVERAALPSDRFKPPFPNKKAAMAANNGAYPPDMSLLAKAREGGADYIYGILVGYADPPQGTTLQPGQYWNRAMHGHIIAMPPPLTADGQVEYEGGGVPATKDQYARDVSQFLTWAAEPHMEQRKRTGLKALMFLLVFAGVSYAVKRRVWRGVPH